MPVLRSKNRPLRLAGTLAIPALLLAGCGQAPPPSSPVKTAVRTQEAKAGQTSDLVTLTGTIQARVQSDLSFRFAGRLAARYVEVGQHVEAGQVLARLDTSQQEADVASAQAALAAAEAVVRETTGTFRRQKSLIESGFTTRTQYDNANQAMLAAEADLKNQRSALDVALDTLKNAELRSHAAGVITARQGEAGQVVDVAQPIFTLAQDGPRDAVFDVYEALVARPAGPLAVGISLLSAPSVTASGRVREVAPAVNAATGTVKVKVAIDDTPRQMGLGAAVAGSGKFRSREVVELPASAFHTRLGKMAVWVVDRETRVTAERLVEVDSFRTGQLLLRSGVQPGELVVTSGGQFVRPGEAVAPINEQARTNTETSK